ncbi:hypothetical protein [Paenibacillus sp. ALJ109b]|uniref:hypothetical protein n=1 Tax=Paenibacillus sp. ALJ109b TaxID=2709068 RepID=UPI0013D2E3D6|nr:hypothetical protein [Paenibacillus sp. ALJ109b]NEU59628.1 hypothetical protein [Paenibacillus sp. ALJ109b]
MMVPKRGNQLNTNIIFDQPHFLSDTGRYYFRKKGGVKYLNKILKHPDWFVLSMVIVGYIGITIVIIFSGEQSLAEKRDLYKMMASTNITLALGFAAILIAVDRKGP